MNSIFVAPEALIESGDYQQALVVDLGTVERYSQQHLPGAVHLPYEAIVSNAPPVSGLMPTAANISATLASIGYSPERAVLAYDDAGGGKAGRLLYTLHALGHHNIRIIDGGLGAWITAGGALTNETPDVEATDFYSDYAGNAVATSAEILAKLDDPATVLLDTRNRSEFFGDVARAERGGHIPGAVHYEWTQAMDPGHQQRLRDLDSIRTELASIGVTPDREVIVYCQTHHRSAHTYALLKELGFDNVKGYPGAWSEWGNDLNLPIA